jgi:hypothetical protein
MRIERYLSTEDLKYKRFNAGILVEKGNWRPSSGINRVIVDGLELDLQGPKKGETCFLHERVWYFTSPSPGRKHPETRHEIIANIGTNNIEYVMGDLSWDIVPGKAVYSVDELEGHWHGFSVEKNKPGILYVAKALIPEYAQGRSFWLPKKI